MVDIFGGFGDGTGILRGPRGPPGRFMYDVKALKKITQTSGKYGDFKKKIQQSLRLGFTPIGEHTKYTGTWFTPLRCYDNNIFTLDNEDAFEVTKDSVGKLLYRIKKEPTLLVYLEALLIGVNFFQRQFSDYFENIMKSTITQPRIL